MDFAARVIRFLDRIKDLGQGDAALVVSHNGPIKVLICHLLNISMEHWWQLRVDTASLSIVDLTARGAMLVRLNDVAHLNA
jgi:broad specificity phosphatase PhoE